ncbi:hypothetical protein GGI06_000241 [Coemansia sp. S85]|nr:hypothetical protein GGI06_000241 [Coemansia sp. S85]
MFSRFPDIDGYESTDEAGKKQVVVYSKDKHLRERIMYEIKNKTKLYTTATSLNILDDGSYAVENGYCETEDRDVYVIYYVNKEAVDVLPEVLKTWLSVYSDKKSKDYDLVYACDGIANKYDDFIENSKYKNIDWLESSNA